MTLRNAFKPHRLAFTTALVLAPFGAFAAGLDVYRTSQEHSLEVRATLTNATREYWDYPGFVHDETDSHRRRFRLIQSNEDPGLDPVAGWTSNITLKAAVEAEGNSVSTEPLANMTTEISNSVISHRTELSYDWQRDTEWVDSVYASARSEFFAPFRISAPQDVVIEVSAIGEYGFPTLSASIWSENDGLRVWAVSWPNHGGDGAPPAGAEISYDGTTRTASMRTTLTLAPGEYEFSSFSLSDYSLHDHWAPYNTAGKTMVRITAVPEAESVGLAMAGLLALGAAWRTRRPGDADGAERQVRQTEA